MTRICSADVQYYDRRYEQAKGLSTPWLLSEFLFKKKWGTFGEHGFDERSCERERTTLKDYMKITPICHCQPL